MLSVVDVAAVVVDQRKEEEILWTDSLEELLLNHNDREELH
jgi:hypothetical protein